MNEYTLPNGILVVLFLEDMVERTPHSSVRAIHRAVAALSDRTGRFQAGAPSQGQDDAAADVVVAATMTRQQKTAAIAGIVALSADASLFLFAAELTLPVRSCCGHVQTRAKPVSMIQNVKITRFFNFS